MGQEAFGLSGQESRFGYYLNIYHTCDGSAVSSLENDYKLYDLVLKYLVIRLEEKELTRAMGRDFEAESQDEKSETKEGNGSAKTAKAKEVVED